MRTLGLVAVAALAGALAAAGVSYATVTGRGTATVAQAPAADASPPATAAVERTTLVAETELDATLGHAAAGILRGGRAGTVTRLPRVGRVLREGDTAIEVDGSRRTILLTGSRPAWRTMRKGTVGPDVEQLERALRALGALPRDVRPDRTFGESTRLAVRTWQRRSGLPVDGVVDLGEVIFAPGPVRLSRLLVHPGDRLDPSTPIAELTQATRSVTLDLAAKRQVLLATGDHVAVELPDGSRAAATVTSVGRVAAATTDGALVLPVTIALDDPAAAGPLDGAPVTVIVTRERRESVLAVPVEALLALREGGYAVEVAGPAGDSHLVGVELGLFDDGLVQVTGDLSPGDRVVVPR